jgi:hypothetical protein
MSLRSLAIVGWMGLASLFVNVATAEDAVAPTTIAVDGVNFSDPDADYYASRFRVDVSDQYSSRFRNLSENGASAPNPDALRQVEVALSARAAAGFDVGFAQRAGLSVNDQGDIERHSRSSELRLGRGLTNMRRRESTAWDQGSWYLFAASDDEALTWAPGSRNNFGGATSGGWALQDRVEVGDMQAGVTYEAGGLQASLAYVEREVSVRAGARNLSQDESFTGLTITMRHQ